MLAAGVGWGGPGSLEWASEGMCEVMHSRPATCTYNPPICTSCMPNAELTGNLYTALADCYLRSDSLEEEREEMTEGACNANDI